MEKPLLDGAKVSPPSFETSTPVRSVASSTRLLFSGSMFTSLMIHPGLPLRTNVWPLSVVRHSPSVVPANTVAGSLASSISTRVRRAVAGMPCTFAKRAPWSVLR